MAKQVKKTVLIADTSLTKYKELSASDLTKWAKEYLASKKVRLNRVNNIPVRRRKGTIEKGWADLQGYNSKGIYVAVEVKKLGDKLSEEQIKRLDDVTNCGAEAYICTQEGKNPKLIAWTEMG